MEGKRHTLFLRDFTEAVEPVAEQFPFPVVHDVLALKNRLRQALDAVTLLGNADYLCSQTAQEAQLFPEGIRGFLKRLCDEEGGKPAVADGQPAQIEGLFQRFRILRILVANLTSGKTGQRHLADALFKGILAAQIRQIVVRPRDRSDTKLYFLRVQHLITPPICGASPRRLFPLCRFLPGKPPLPSPRKTAPCRSGAAFL